jgi:hypothetical protein
VDKNKESTDSKVNKARQKRILTLQNKKLSKIPSTSQPLSYITAATLNRKLTKLGNNLQPCSKIPSNVVPASRSQNRYVGVTNALQTSSTCSDIGIKRNAQCIANTSKDQMVKRKVQSSNNQPVLTPLTVNTHSTLTKQTTTQAKSPTSSQSNATNYNSFQASILLINHLI